MKGTQCLTNSLRSAEAEILKNSFLTTKFLGVEQFPLPDFGTLVDGLKTATDKGVSKETFNLITGALFGSAPQLPTGVTFSKGYPMPDDLARLLAVSRFPVEAGGKLHPSMIEKASLEGLLRLQKYSLWIEYRKREAKQTLEKIIGQDVDKYKDFVKKDKLQVTS